MTLSKKLSAIISISLIAISVSSAAVSASESISESQELFEYYMQTGEVPAIGESISCCSSRIIIGDESRVKVSDTSVYPYRVIGKLYTSVGNSTCAAFANNAVLTAAHCVYNSDANAMGSFTKIEFGRNDDYTYRTVTATPAEIIVNPDYITNPVSKNDWAIIIFGSNITGGACFGYKNNLSVNDAVITTGYPKAGSVSGNTGYSQWTCTGSVTAVNGTLINIDMDVNKGQSGSPIYTSDNYIKAICVAENSTLGVNLGCKISDELYTLMASIRAGTYEIGSYSD